MASNTKKYLNPFIKKKEALLTADSLMKPSLEKAISLHQQGKLLQAEAIYRKLLEADPRNPDAFHLLGVIANQTGHLQGAIDLIGRAIEINPYQASYYSNLGNVLKKLQRFNDAVECYDKAISLYPDYADAYYNRGNALKELKQLEASVASYDKAIALKSDNAEAYCNRGIAFKELQRLDDAIASYDKAIALNPDYAEAYSNRGIALQRLNQLNAALASYNKAISLQPDFAEAYSNRGIALKELNDLDAAVASYDKAIELKPDYAEAYSNRGNALKDLNQLEDSVVSYDKAIALSPSLAEAYSNRGNALKDLKQLDAALLSYEKAIALNPDYAEAYWNKSLLLLLTGQLIPGFNLYEWRWKSDEIHKLKRNFSQPLWLGEEPLIGKTILLHSEQGLGDSIQFCRYVKMVSDLGANVFFEVQKSLLPLLKRNFSQLATLISKDDALPEFDVHCPVMSLPLAFNTNLNSIPYPNSYLEAEADRVASWKFRLNSGTFKIGISWQGSKGTKADVGRSFDLILFEKIAMLPNVQLISLQKGFGSEQLKNTPQNMKVIDLGSELDADGAFLDSSALMMSLDLVITSDTALAHLAGALGIKTWVVLKYVPEWRWLLDRQDSPWYSSITLYRQQKLGEWQPVFDQMLIDINIMRRST